ncbi:hypothetical protein [Hymenobacter volaticus]|uniref:Uncharacterized protein n=1 Tax=Hymenobacter volaticus TaxID=2932254 RepID=A0ABY4GEW6_9BACT|nr:hypothetical protein [Hymenobacter volaticus]UOQ69477.1 hypothetical protein MUN86_28785 [Hymenobacter volaticus]
MLFPRPTPARSCSSGDNRQAVLRMLRQAREETTTAEHIIAVLHCAEAALNAGPAGYNTLIRVYMKGKQLPALRQQLAEELLPEVIVFLPHLTRLHIECDGVAHGGGAERGRKRCATRTGDTPEGRRHPHSA